MTSLPDTSRERALRPVPRRGLSDAFPLVLLCMGLIYTDARFTFLDEEALALNAAARSFRAILGSFRSGAGLPLPGHPPLYDLLLHGCLRFTGGAPDWLRVPSIVFYLVGLWFLSRAACRAGGEQSGTALVWLSALWPYGFHVGRVAGSYSLSFLLISALTWAYLRHAAAPSRRGWVTLCLLALALVYTTYFGWIFLALLGFEDWFQSRGRERPALPRLLASGALLLAAYLPLWRAFGAELRFAVNLHQPLRTFVFNAAYNLYVLFVSESVGPWYWKFSVPAALAAAACLWLLFAVVRREALRFLLYGLLLLAAMAFPGTLNTSRLLLVAPWFLLPAAIALGTIHTLAWRRLMAISLAVVAWIGWYGILFRTYYAAQQFLEPWADMAVVAGTSVREGAAVISNNPSFFLYLTYALRAPQTNGPWRFAGILPSDVRYPQIWSADDWQAAGRPIPPTVVWIESMPPNASMEAASVWLDQHCGDRIDRHMVRDPGDVWKQRFSAEPGAAPWQIETRQYSCGGDAAGPPPGTVAPGEPR